MQRLMSVADDWRRFLDSDIFYSFRHSRLTVVAALVTLVLVLAALFAPWIAPHNPFDVATLSLMDSELPPVWMEGATGASCSAPTARGATCCRRCSMACACRWWWGLPVSSWR
ncbi:hypothetical protein [Marinobacterium aestuariivivens]|uniref:Oligopeptide transport permease C-like N-terminal domain-containing protein n=1 Tax=Marinobacterium aestuariivivens TaxID=1698799 RepID=A0ABW2A869_9GAMM